MEAIKLILVDIDGTLLNDQLEVTPMTREAILKLREVNIQFGIATGRSPYAVKKLIRLWGIEEAVDVILGFNGSALLDVRNDEMSSFFMLDGQAILDLKREFGDLDCNMGVYDRETYHALKDDEIARKTAQFNHFNLVVDDLSAYTDTYVNKVLITAEAAVIDEIIKRYNHHHAESYHAFRSGDVRLECVNPEISKSKGIALLCEKMHLTADEVMTFGDMMNDYDMIRDYVGVAMGNADERLKSVARYQTASINEDGIGVFINKHFLSIHEV